jgi:glutamine synthetase adenylyltransferase
LLKQRGILSDENFAVLSEGYLFLRRLDHALRLVVGRAARLPDTGHPLLLIVSGRLKLESPDELMQKLTAHRVEIRQCFEEILR